MALSKINYDKRKLYQIHIIQFRLFVVWTFVIYSVAAAGLSLSRCCCFFLFFFYEIYKCV